MIPYARWPFCSALWPLGELGALGVLAVSPRGADGPDNQGGQTGGVKNLSTWPPWAGGVKNAVPLANPWPSGRITKAIIRGVSRNDRLDRLRLPSSKTRFSPADALQMCNVPRYSRRHNADAGDFGRRRRGRARSTAVVSAGARS